MPRTDGRPARSPASAPVQRDPGLVDALTQLTFAVQGRLTRIAAAYDMSIIQTRLFGILRDRRPTIKELAAYLQLDKSSVTGLVDRAEQRGLVRRIASELDRRSVQVTITESGLELFSQARAAFEAEIAALVADLDAGQRSQLSAIASLVVLTDARQRGIDVTDWSPAAG